MIRSVQQSTNTLIMISPDSFQYNEQTASTNAFQTRAPDVLHPASMAMMEFETMVSALRQQGIRVLVMSSRSDLPTPDAVFPNNWFSTHITTQGERVLVLYPMQAENRRLERQFDKLMQAFAAANIVVDKLIDLTAFEGEGKYLEGTGSLVIDRVQGIVYAALSPRTDKTLVLSLCEKLNYKAVTFHAYDRAGHLIYHTNVVMSVGTDFAVVTVDSIHDEDERRLLLAHLQATKKKVLTLSLAQMDAMTGNILEVCSVNGDAKIVMSKTAYQAFTNEQRIDLSYFGELVVVNIETIEKLGGGSARCMLAELF